MVTFWNIYDLGTYIYSKYINLSRIKNMSRTKIREIIIKESKGSFSFGKDTKISKKDYNFEGLSALRQLLNPEKARLLHVIKTQKPNSMYDLAKKLGRGFKAVNDDIKLLERFGFVELIAEKTKKRIRHKPEIIVDTVKITLKI
jgi:predicted transcriptional regulator